MYGLAEAVGVFYDVRRVVSRGVTASCYFRFLKSDPFVTTVPLGSDTEVRLVSKWCGSDKRTPVSLPRQGCGSDKRISMSLPSGALVTKGPLYHCQVVR